MEGSLTASLAGHLEEISLRFPKYCAPQTVQGWEPYLLAHGQCLAQCLAHWRTLMHLC